MSHFRSVWILEYQFKPTRVRPPSSRESAGSGRRASTSGIYVCACMRVCALVRSFVHPLARSLYRRRGEVIPVRLMEISRNVRCGFLRWRNERGHGALNIAVDLGRARARTQVRQNCLAVESGENLPTRPVASRRGFAESRARKPSLPAHAGWCTTVRFRRAVSPEGQRRMPVLRSLRGYRR